MAAQRTNGREPRQTESTIAFPTQFKSRQKVPTAQWIFYTHPPQPRNPAYCVAAVLGPKSKSTTPAIVTYYYKWWM
jgi:hypothetical protein